MWLWELNKWDQCDFASCWAETFENTQGELNKRDQMWLCLFSSRPFYNTLYNAQGRNNVTTNHVFYSNDLKVADEITKTEDKNTDSHCFLSFLTDSHCFSPNLTVSHRFLPFLTVSHRFLPFLSDSHRFLPFLTDSHRFTLILSDAPEVMHQRWCTRGDAPEEMHQRRCTRGDALQEKHQMWCTREFRLSQNF